ncbi:chorion class high-cysteine HCB protein 13-like [Gopherus flavomarginatus]|uniref:chorion class high-cysteine HCB protein 13-like n=1 Tax=Gopherus flavomarginatus TaxID=286002 RepID=UPI0021CBC594|nr:chorion class high-cysteine HCB protein 13-like [Gopherus flavomarginatus]
MAVPAGVSSSGCAHTVAVPAGVWLSGCVCWGCARWGVVVGLCVLGLCPLGCGCRVVCAGAVPTPWLCPLGCGCRVVCAGAVPAGVLSGCAHHGCARWGVVVGLCVLGLCPLGCGSRVVCAGAVPAGVWLSGCVCWGAVPAGVWLSGCVCWGCGRWGVVVGLRAPQLCPVGCGCRVARAAAVPAGVWLSGCVCWGCACWGVVVGLCVLGLCPLGCDCRVMRELQLCPLGVVSALGSTRRGADAAVMGGGLSPVHPALTTGAGVHHAPTTAPPHGQPLAPPGGRHDPWGWEERCREGQWVSVP